MSKQQRAAVLAELRIAEQAVRMGEPEAVIVHLEEAIRLMRAKEAARK